MSEPVNCHRCGRRLRWAKRTGMKSDGVEGPRDFDDPSRVPYHLACRTKALEIHDWQRHFLTTDCPRIRQGAHFE